MLRLLFLGSNNFPIPIFAKLAQSKRIEITGLLTAPHDDKSDFLMIAKDHNIPIFQPQNISHDARQILGKTKPEIILVCNYGQILDNTILKYPKFGCLNIHCSILPQLRGACPIEMAILQGLKKSGVTIQRMEKELDTGDILFQKQVKIAKNETGGSLREKMKKISTEVIEKVILDWVNGKIEPKKQDHSKATYCFRKDISKQAARIDWDNTAEQIERKIRAFNPKPTSWTILKTKMGDKRLKIFKADVLKKDIGKAPAATIVQDNTLYIQARKGTVLPKALQLEGKSQVSIKEFLLGFREEICPR